MESRRETRLVLLRHAATEATRAGRFPAGETIDAAGREEARRARDRIGPYDRAFCSPLARAQATADAMGIVCSVDPRLAECDFGAWAGRSLDEVRADVGGDVVEAWRADPASAPHGGESLRDVAARVRDFLAAAHGLPGTTLAITHGGVIRLAIVLARREPLDRMWSVGVGPLSATRLHSVQGVWAPEGEPSQAAANV